MGNLHSHTFQRAMAGLAERRGPSERDSFWTWRAVMYRFLDLLTPEEIEAVAAQAFMEMQEAGFAAVAEFHYLHNRPGGAAYAADRKIVTPAFGETVYRGRVGLLHIDGNHDYGHVLDDISAWGPFVQPAGWIIFDDYEWYWGDGVRRAVVR